MKKSKKDELVAQLTDQFQQSPTVYLTDFTGLSVKPMTDLRRKLRAAGVQYVVVKNTLALRAMASASVTGLEEDVTGPTGMVFAGEEPVETAKVLAQFQKEHETLQLKAALVEGRRLGPEEIKRLATLPSREQLLAQLAGAMQAPLQGFAGAVSSLLYQFVGAVEALRAERADA
jgi:large subunit ribosomal protein L10